jgi:phenylalanine-4-hydroxylase
MREGKVDAEKAFGIFEIVSSKHSNDWLLPLEIAEILHNEKVTSSFEIVLNYLEHLKTKRPEVSHLIENGLQLFET